MPDVSASVDGEKLRSWLGKVKDLLGFDVPDWKVSLTFLRLAYNCIFGCSSFNM
jgi:hypothetical protein